MGEQALIFYLDDVGRRADEMGVDDLDALVALTQAIEPTCIGVVDGHEIAIDGSEGSLYAYGADAKDMLAAALPIICRSPSRKEGGPICAIVQLRMRQRSRRSSRSPTFAQLAMLDWEKQ
jgi:hypothetical protein